MPWHTVTQGEWLSQIAHRHGFSGPDAIWDHPENGDLKAKRPQHHLLCPGDRVFIPEREIRSFDCATGQRHRFTYPKRTRLHVVILDEDDQPLARKPFELVLDGEVMKGKTDGSGALHLRIPVTARHGRLRIAGHELTLQVGGLDAAGEITGAQGRLNNMGYRTGEVDGVIGPRTRAALRAFQHHEGLRETGELDDATLRRLEQKHGC